MLGADTLPYRLLLPKNDDAAKRYPLLVFLHGFGERGADNNRQLIHGAQLFLKAQAQDSFAAIVVMP
jgi:predicted peptidase